ncbi:MAG TPA: polymer-forming cytoskeletal protein [Trueperaceae bacterium]|nr:polymer-forming cytoskeletal protein [Trueperaceae bacterium]
MAAFSSFGVQRVRPEVPRRAAWLVAALLVVATAVAENGPAGAATVTAPGLIVGGSYTVATGTTVRGDLNAVGASVIIAPGATLDGQLVAVGGSTVVDGMVTGDVRAYGGSLRLGDRAAIAGDLTTDYAAFERAPAAVVSGRLTEGSHGPVRFDLPSYVHGPVGAVVRGAVPRSPAALVGRALVVGLLAALMMTLIPRRVARVRDAVVQHPVRMGIDGMLTGIVATVLLAVLVVTLIGIPLAVLGGVLLYLSVLFGWVAFGDAVGEYLSGAFQQEWGPVLRMGIGAFALALAAAILEVVPVLGGLAMLALSSVALGAVRATRYGGREPRVRPSEGPRPTVPQA